MEAPEIAARIREEMHISLLAALPINSGTQIRCCHIEGIGCMGLRWDTLGESSRSLFQWLITHSPFFLVKMYP